MRLLRPQYGSVALSLCTTTHPLYTRSTNIFGTSISIATMRPDPRSHSQGLAATQKSCGARCGRLTRLRAWHDEPWVVISLSFLCMCTAVGALTSDSPHQEIKGCGNEPAARG